MPAAGGRGPASRATAYPRAVALVRESVRRERRALESVRLFTAKGSPSERMLNAVVAQLPTDAGAEAPVVFYTALTGEKVAPASALSPEEGASLSACPP